jgi:hypothetical protein
LAPNFAALVSVQFRELGGQLNTESSRGIQYCFRLVVRLYVVIRDLMELAEVNFIQGFGQLIAKFGCESLSEGMLLGALLKFLALRFPALFSS